MNPKSLVGRTMNILVVEDNVDDILLIEKAVGLLEDTLFLHSVTNGEDAYRYLQREGMFAGRPRPDLVLLDWHLTRVHGRDILELIRADPNHLMTVVCVMTASRSRRDIDDAFTRNCNMFLPKPLTLDKIKMVLQVWNAIALTANEI